jgi:hypothetical protein
MELRGSAGGHPTLPLRLWYLSPILLVCLPTSLHLVGKQTYLPPSPSPIRNSWLWPASSWPSLQLNSCPADPAGSAGQSPHKPSTRHKAKPSQEPLTHNQNKKTHAQNHTDEDKRAQHGHINKQPRKAGMPSHWRPTRGRRGSIKARVKQERVTTATRNAELLKSPRDER